jgi:hypothetical protein
MKISRHNTFIVLSEAAMSLRLFVITTQATTISFSTENPNILAAFILLSYLTAQTMARTRFNQGTTTHRKKKIP